MRKPHIDDKKKPEKKKHHEEAIEEKAKEVEKQQYVICKFHYQQYLKISEEDEDKFQIYCTVCEEDLSNIRSINITTTTDLDLIKKHNNKEEDIATKGNSNNKSRYISCYKNIQEEGVFYCFDCNQYIGPTCIATTCRYHLSDTPEEVLKKINIKLTTIHGNLTDISRNTQDNLNILTPAYNFYTSNKNKFKSMLDKAQLQTTTKLNSKIKQYQDDIKKIFHGVDEEVEAATNRLKKAKIKAENILNDYNNILNGLNSLKGSYAKCLYKKNHDELIEQNKSFFERYSEFIGDNLVKTQNNTKQELQVFISKCKEHQNLVSLYESCLVNSVLSAIPNKLHRGRRFFSYYFIPSRFFKCSSVSLKMDKNITLCGLGLCGLYINPKELEEITNNQFNNNNSNNNNSNNKKLSINITILEAYSDDDIINNSNNNSIRKDTNSEIGKKLIEFDVNMNQVLNPTDPVFTHYFKNAITLKKTKTYYIRVNNIDNSNDSYLNFWTGLTNNNNSDRDNFMSNNTNVSFTFENPKSIESDLNEITGGLISDLFYSLADN